MLNAQRSTPLPAPSLSGLQTLVRDDLAGVNRILTEALGSDVPLITQLSAHIIAAGGKRLRPSLTLATAKMLGYQGNRHLQLAACVEFIHTATLLHDDVVDESTLRRGEATANSLFGNQASVLVGDFLLSRAFQLMVSDGSLAVLKILSDAAAIIARGEVKQLAVSGDPETSEEDYLDVIGSKTAALFAAACELGAVVSGETAHQETLRAFGYKLGMAFQLVDDVLDYEETAESMGKNAGDDFREGKITLPVILAYRAGGPDEQAFWSRSLSVSASREKDFTEAQRLIRAHKALEATRNRATEYAQEAIGLLQDFPESAAKSALVEAARFSVSRGF